MTMQTVTALSAILIAPGMTPVLAQNRPYIGGWTPPAQQQQLMKEAGYTGAG
jgi:hypothetical protein